VEHGDLDRELLQPPFVDEAAAGVEVAGELVGRRDGLADHVAVDERVHLAAALAGLPQRRPAGAADRLEPLGRRHLLELGPVVDGVARRLPGGPVDQRRLRDALVEDRRDAGNLDAVEQVAVAAAALNDPGLGLLSGHRFLRCRAAFGQVAKCER
jgi:hypothetical protein